MCSSDLQGLGIQPIKDKSALAEARDQFVKTNAALITSQPQEVADRVAAHIHAMVPTGARWETIAKKLEDEEGIAHRRAALIARDQVAKYNADLSRIQMQSCGIEFYQWRGTMDNRERPSHVALEGTVWSFDKPPPLGNPGEPIQCLPGDSPIQWAPDVQMAFRRWYNGELCEFVSDSGPFLRCTPNHPVLTDTGWKAAQFVDIGDKFVSEIKWRPAERLGEADVDHAKPTIEQMFNALAIVGFVMRSEEHTSELQSH